MRTSFSIGLKCQIAAIAFCLLLIPSVTFNQSKYKINTWSFIGSNNITSKELQSYLVSKGVASYHTLMNGRIESFIKERYAFDGYYHCTVDSIKVIPTSDSSLIDLHIFISEHFPTTIGKIIIKGIHTIAEQDIRREMDLQPENVFSQNVLHRDIESILNLYERHGFPFTSVSIPQIQLYDSSGVSFISVTIDIQEKDKFVISEIITEGNTHTDADVIIRETRIHTGDVFDADKVNDIKRRLEKLNFFSSISEPQLYQRGMQGGLKIRVNEGNTNIFDGVIGYQPPRSSNESGYLTGLVNVSFKNLFGTGRKFQARWERAGQNIQEIELRYLEPWLFALPLNIEGGFYQRQQDSTYVSRSFDGNISLLATENIHLNILGKTFSVIPSQDITTQYVNRSTTITAGLELVIDTRDNIYNPSSGVLFRNGYSGGNKSFTAALTSERTSNYIQHLTLDLSYFQQIFQRNIFAVSVHGREIRGSNLDAADYYRVGGANTLRGYREEQFQGTRIAWTNLEYRYSLTRQTFASAFFDYGYIFLPADNVRNISEFIAWKSGYGLGIRLETALGIMALSYALGNGDGITNGKIHFGLVNEF